MIDIHCHILPAVDDGPVNVDESILMAREAVKEGIKTIVATPHHKNNTYINTKEQVLESVALLNQTLKKEEIPLNILPGQESRIFGEILEDYKNGDVLTINNTRYLFVEFPSSTVPRYADRLFFELQNEGIIPIIVHPERNKDLIENPIKLYQLVKNGALTQVTAASITGFFGKKIKKFSYQLLECNLTHFVSSDAHNIHNRSFKLAYAYSIIEKEFGLEYMHMLMDNSKFMVNDEIIEKELPIQIKRKRLLGIF